MLLPNNKLCIAIFQLKILYTHLKGSINKASAIASPPTPPQHFRLVVGNYDGHVTNRYFYRGGEVGDTDPKTPPEVIVFSLLGTNRIAALLKNVMLRHCHVLEIAPL